MFPFKHSALILLGLLILSILRTIFLTRSHAVELTIVVKAAGSKLTLVCVMKNVCKTCEGG